MQLKRLATTAALCATIVTSFAITSGTASAAVAVRGTYTPVDPTRILDTRDGTESPTDTGPHVTTTCGPGVSDQDVGEDLPRQ